MQEVTNTELQTKLNALIDARNEAIRAQGIEPGKIGLLECDINALSSWLRTRHEAAMAMAILQQRWSDQAEESANVHAIDPKAPVN